MYICICMYKYIYIYIYGDYQISQCYPADREVSTTFSPALDTLRKRNQKIVALWICHGLSENQNIFSHQYVWTMNMFGV